MTSYSVARESNMFLFKRRNDRIKEQEAELKAVRKDLAETVNKVNVRSDKLAELLEREGVTGRIFLATGGKGRIK